MARTYYRSKTRCHLCELPIPSDIVSPHHPLAGTIDHIQPLSLGGTDKAANRAPAHRCCNNARKNLDITPEVRKVCLDYVIAAFAKRGVPDGKRWVHLRALVRNYHKKYPALDMEK